LVEAARISSHSGELKDLDRIEVSSLSELSGRLAVFAKG
jgi:hypothetical protein